MTDGRSRRKFIGRLAGAAGGVIVGFDPATRSWATARSRRPLLRLPQIAGTLTQAQAALEETAQDNGRIVRRMPLAVLRPGNVEDVVAISAFDIEGVISGTALYDGRIDLREARRALAHTDA